MKIFLRNQIQAISKELHTVTPKVSDLELNWHRFQRKKTGTSKISLKIPVL